MTGHDKKEDLKEHDAASDFDFLQERIKERPINKKKLLKKTIITALMAVLFGLLACLSFLLLEPVLNNWLYPEEAPEIVTFPQEQEEMLPEDMLTEGGSTQLSETVQEGSDAQATQLWSQETVQAGTELEAENDTSAGVSEPLDASDVQEEEFALKPYLTQYEELF